MTTIKRYNIIKDFLNGINSELVSSIEDLSANTISYKCSKGHLSTITTNTFASKKSKYKKKHTTFCGICSDPSKGQIKKSSNNQSSNKPSRRYTNLDKYLKSINFKLVTSLEDYNNTKKITFQCQRGHLSPMTFNCFANKKGRYKDEPSKLCSKCGDSQNNLEEHRKEKLKQIQDKLQTKHTILTWKSNNEITYRCGNCGEENSSGKWNLLRQTTTQCRNCVQNGNRKDYDQLDNEVKALGFVLLTSQKTYTSNKNIDVLCVCGSSWNTSLHNILRGRRCTKCKTKRTYSTNYQKYGVNNVFQSEQIKEKSKITCIQKYGVDHSSKHPDVQKKKEETCFTNHQVKWGFTKPEVYQKIQQTHLKKYGCKFPLQSPIIQKKIDDVFMEKLGVRRPMLSQYFRDLMLDMYGNELYVLTDDYKKKMVDMYGNEIYVLTDDYKKKMVDRYGNECPARCPELFRKAVRTSYMTKPYTFGDKTWMIRGYENRCLDVLLKDEKIDPDDIVSDEKDTIPNFRYDCKNCVKCGYGNYHIYYPDFYIESQNRIIEVKSAYTLQRDIAKIKHKLNAVIDNGYSCELWVFDRTSLVDKCNLTDKNCVDKIIDKYRILV